MGVPILILGESGSGKSSSLRNFEPDEVGIFNVASKPLPFRKPLKKVDRAGYKTIIKALSKPSLKRYVIDDSQYLLVFEAFDKAKEVGYGKFTDMAKNFYDLLQFIIQNTPPGLHRLFPASCAGGRAGQGEGKNGRQDAGQFTYRRRAVFGGTDGKNRKRAVLLPDPQQRGRYRKKPHRYVYG